MMLWGNERIILGGGLVLFTLALFGIIIWKGIGGEVTTGAIIGHLAAWTELVVIFYFRKKAQG